MLWNPGNLLSSEYLGSVPLLVVWAILKTALPSTKEIQVSCLREDKISSVLFSVLCSAQLAPYCKSPVVCSSWSSLPGDRSDCRREEWGRSVWKATVRGTIADVHKSEWALCIPWTLGFYQSRRWGKSGGYFYPSSFSPRKDIFPVK